MDHSRAGTMLKRLRGFPDHLPEQSFQLDSLLSVITELFKNFDFQRVDFPLLESSELFSRSLGEGSDIVNKEMYSFQKGEESFTLRPEGTASIARMFISHKLHKQLPLRWYYQGPMFRHERPQKGRFRQFHQAGVEFLGDFSETADLEMLSLVWLLVKKLNLETKAVLEINSLGSLEERKNYKEKLKKYLSPLKGKLSHDSQIRLEKNPLRIWDSKEEGDREIMKKAPLLNESLQQLSLQKYEKIKGLLSDLKIPFRENARLVRGLDYYNDLVFECVSGDLGAQSAVLAGGRYDRLMESLGGPSVPAVGWALGLERLSLLCRPFQREPVQIGLLAVGEAAEKQALQLAHQLRLEGFSLYYRLSGNFSKQMKRISQKNCRWALIFGKKEIRCKEVILKNLSSGEQKSLPLSQWKEELKKIEFPEKS